MKKHEKQDGLQNRIFTIPNILSFMRLCLIPLFVWLYCVEEEFILTAYILILSGVTDVADGFIARHFHMTSDLGKILDPIADKLTQAAMLFCLLTSFPLMLAPLALMVLKELYMGITGLMVIKKTGHVYSSRWHGKAATCLLYAMMLLHVLWHDIPAPLSNASILLCLIMMALSMVLYGSRNMRLIKEAGKNTDGETTL